MKLFKPEDFEYIWGQSDTGAEDYGHPIVEIANRIFKKWLEQQPVVEGVTISSFNHYVFCSKIKGTESLATHRARLVCIEPIVQEQHECVPAEVIVQVGQYTKSVTFDYSSKSICKICGAELKAKWEKV